MNENQIPSPLQLAHLSASLVQAHIVPKSDARGQLAATLQYLESCEEAMAVHSANQLAKIEDQSVGNFLAEYDLTEGQKLEIPSSFIKDAVPFEAKPVPVERIVNFCRANRIKPSTSELKKIEEPRQWDRLSKIDRINSIFLVLTLSGCPWPLGYVSDESRPGVDELRMFYPGPLDQRRSWLAAGVPFGEARTHLHIMQHAMRERPRIKGKEGAEKKHRKPRAPKGESGQYEKKKRGSRGIFKSQK